MRGVIYARYSSSNQREESIEGQIRENTAYANKHGIEIVGTYIDRALSGKTDNRPEFKRMIKDSAKKNFDVVIVWKLDRFSRDRYDSAFYKVALKKNGVRVVSATESISAGAEGVLMETMLEGLAQYYVLELAEKVNRGMKENALKSMFNGGVIPLGFCVDKEKHYQIDEKTAPLIRELFQRYASGESMADIVEDLNAKGIRTARGNRFNKNSLTRIFSNRKYIGEYRYKDVVTPNAFPALVSEELFERVAARLAKNKHATGKAKAPEPYLLTTKLFCGTCKTMMIGDSANKPNGTIYRYYKCAASRQHKCNRKAVRKEWIEELVIQLVLSRLNDEKTVNRIADDVIDLLHEENAVIPVMEAQLREVRSRIDNIMASIEKGVVTRTTKARLEELEAEEDKLLTSLQLEQAKVPKITKGMILFLLDKFRQMDMRVLKNREKLIDSLVKAIILYDDRVLIYLTYTDETVTIPTSEEISDVENSLDVTSLGVGNGTRTHNAWNHNPVLCQLNYTHHI